jgi:hypothetical protein
MVVLYSKSVQWIYELIYATLCLLTTWELIVRSVREMYSDSDMEITEYTELHTL